MTDILVALWHVLVAVLRVLGDLWLIWIAVVAIGWIVGVVDVRWRGWRHFSLLGLPRRP